MELLVLSAVAIVVFIFWGRGTLRRRSRIHNVAQTAQPAKRVLRLTDNQIVCLSSASATDPIYAEKPSYVHSQMPNGAMCFNQRTVDSLVKRGFLVGDGKGGYLLTKDGEQGLRIGMGFNG
jgi:hypothetical protein